MSSSSQEPNLNALIDSTLPKAMQDLQQAHTNIEQIAEYCRQTYAREADTNAVFSRTQNYIKDALSNVAYHVHTVSLHLGTVLLLEANELEQMDLQVNIIAQVFALSSLVSLFSLVSPLVSGALIFGNAALSTATETSTRRSRTARIQDQRSQTHLRAPRTTAPSERTRVPQQRTVAEPGTGPCAATPTPGPQRAQRQGHLVRHRHQHRQRQFAQWLHRPVSELDLQSPSVVALLSVMSI
jgi:hypothetical protein